MSSLNENHRRRILSTFTYTDKLLQSVERLASTQLSPFAHEQPDLADAERRLLLALVQRARERMLSALDRFGIPRPRAGNSARWSTDTALQFAEVSLSELDAETLRGYGAVDETDALEVTAVANDLRAIVERGRRLLRPREGTHLEQRLTAVPGRAGEILREVARISSDRGLVELRALIAAAAERASATSFEVGVFGRVSAGKSSLINALIGHRVLPVGATPVTAVPLRIRHGDSRLTVRHADGRTATVEIGTLPEYATEEQNPQNRKEIAEIDLTIPSLDAGLTLLDTPGVGALSLSGPAQTFAALPRCDLGLVLASAGTPLGGDELALVSALQHAGIAVQLLLSKSDLLADRDRVRAVEYLRNELREVDAAGAIPVFPVSSMSAGATLLEAWRTQALTPLIAARQASSLAALRRRLGALLDNLDSALTARESRASDESLSTQKARVAAEAAIDHATALLEHAASATIEAAAAQVAAAWGVGRGATSAAREALTKPAAQALAAVREAADSVAGSPETGGDEVGGHLPPLFDPAFLETLGIREHPSMLDRVLGRTRARSRLLPLAPALDTAYSRYASRLREWGTVRLRERFELHEAMVTSGQGRLTPEVRALLAVLHGASDEELLEPLASQLSTAAPIPVGAAEPHE